MVYPADYLGSAVSSSVEEFVPDKRLFMWNHPDETDLNFRWRHERTSRQYRQVFDVQVVLGDDGQPGPLRVVWWGAHSKGNLRKRTFIMMSKFSENFLLKSLFKKH